MTLSTGIGFPIFKESYWRGAMMTRAMGENRDDMPLLFIIQWLGQRNQEQKISKNHHGCCGF